MLELAWTIARDCDRHRLPDWAIGMHYCPEHHTIHVGLAPPYLPPEDHIEDISYELGHEVTHAVLCHIGEVEASLRYNRVDEDWHREVRTKR